MAIAHAELWERLRARQDPAAREQLILHYLWLVRYVAGRLAIGLPPHVEFGDLESHGIFGLLDAVDRFEPGRGVRFETYAIPWVRGAILAGLRATHWAPALLRRARRLEAAYAELEAALLRPPTPAELARHMGITLEELDRRQQELGCVAVLSMEEIGPDDGDAEPGVALADQLADPNAVDPGEEAAAAERRELLARALEQLAPRERQVVELYYYEGLTLQEIAAVLDLSPARISQLHSKAILRLRGRLARAKALLVS